jgi:hypothetical protein
MSATGQGGVTIITGRNHSTLIPVAIPSGSELVFTHNVGRRAFSVIVTSGNPAENYGQVLTSADNVFVVQPNENQIVVQYPFGASDEIVFISCRWEEPTPELDLVPVDSGKIVIQAIPSPPSEPV